MIGIKNALQNVVNVMAILTGLIAIYQFMKSK